MNENNIKLLKTDLSWLYFILLYQSTKIEIWLSISKILLTLVFCVFVGINHYQEEFFLWIIALALPITSMSLSKYIKLRKKSDIMRAKVQKHTESLGIDLNKSGNIVSDCTGIVLGRYSHNALLYLT